jgi:beta-mannanase
MKMENMKKQILIFYVFPFRDESKKVFEWAMTKSDSWKPVYYMALLQGSVNISGGRD